MSSTALAFSPATASSCLLRLSKPNPCKHPKTTTLLLKPSPLTADRRRRRIFSTHAVNFFPPTRRIVSCRVASASVEAQEKEEAGARIGARVRVKVSLKVHHVPCVPEVELRGMEGVVSQYVGVWKGKRISANLPYKVEFVRDVEGRGPVKFFAHLKEDEFECVD